MIHFESNYYNVKVEALKGAKLLNVESGNEIQRFSIGQIVKVQKIVLFALILAVSLTFIRKTDIIIITLFILQNTDYHK